MDEAQVSASLRGCEDQGQDDRDSVCLQGHVGGQPTIYMVRMSAILGRT